MSKEAILAVFFTFAVIILVAWMFAGPELFARLKEKGR